MSEQKVRDGFEPIGNGHQQRRGTVFVLRVDFRRVGQQRFDYAPIATLGGLVQWSVATAVHRLNAGLVVEQQLNHALVAVAGGAVQRCPPRVTLRPNVGAVRQEELRYDELSQVRCIVKGRVPAGNPGVNQVRAVFDQGLDASDLVGFGGGGGSGGFGRCNGDGQAGVEGGNLPLELEQVALGRQEGVLANDSPLHLLLLVLQLLFHQLDLLLQ